MKTRIILSSIVMGVLVSLAGEEWDGQALTVYGDASTGEVYVKDLTDDTLSASTVKLGTEKGSAELHALNSTITLSSSFYLGNEASPGYTALTSRLSLTNSTLTSLAFYPSYKTRGNADDGNERFTVNLGPNGKLACSYVYHYGAGYSRFDFCGGRMSATSVDQVVRLNGSDWKGSYPNGCVTFVGVDAPIDIEIQQDSKLARGYASRGFRMRGNGGFVKRGAGTLIWGWHTTGSNTGTLKNEASYTGDTVVKEGGIRMAQPSSVAKSEVVNTTPAKSALVVEEDAFFDLNGCTANFLGVSGGGLVTNGVAEAGTFTLGAQGGDVSFSPAIVGGAFNVRKRGTGLMTIGAPAINGAFTLEAGSAKITASVFSAESISVAAGTTLDIRGVTVNCLSLDVAKGGLLLKDGGTVLNTTIDAADDISVYGGRYADGGTLVKTGSGTLTFKSPCAKSGGSFIVAEGVATVEKSSTFAGKYFRIQYYDAAQGDNSAIQMSEFSLYGVDGQRINQGDYKYTALDGSYKKYPCFDGIDDATQLEEEEVAVWGKGDSYYFVYDADKYSPKFLFDGDPSTGLRNTYYWKGSNYLVFRIPAEKPDAYGFTFTTGSASKERPLQWKLWGSTTGAKWTELASNFTNTSDATVWAYLTNSTPKSAKTEYNGGEPYPLNLLSAPETYAPFGTAGVGVAADARLELPSVGATLSRLVVDNKTGVGGTISCFTPTEEGVLDVTLDVPVGDFVAEKGAVLFSVPQIAEPRRLKKWTIRVNGVTVKGLSLFWSDGYIRLGYKPGLALIVR